jgi:type IV secretory pathway TraG/TraD family ATPase VirD4
MRIARWYRQFFFGKQATAAWTGVLAAMTLIYKPGDCVYLGRLWAFGAGLWQPLGIRGSKHVTVVASTGSGKTRWLMAWLGMLHKKGSAFVVDCDGQMVNALGPSLERKGHRVINLDPYKLTGFPGACWNAIEEIDRAVKRHGRESAVRFAYTLAEALLKEDNSTQPVFANSARVFLHGLVLYVWLFEPEERRNLIRVRELLTRGLPERVIDPKQDPFDVLLSAMRQGVEFDDGCEGQIVAVIARAASVMKSGKNREGGNPFRSTAVVQTAWLDLPEIAAISGRSDFSCEDLKTGNPCVFVCAPVTDIQTKLAGWVRALTMMSAYAFQNMPGRLKIPCAFCIDEMPSLGRIEALETAAPAFRKFGIRLVVITQDLEKLRQVYPHSWEGFIGNSMCTLWMSTDHQQTLEYLSKVLGMRTLKSKVDDGAISKVRARMEKREYALMTPDQLREFLDPSRGQIIAARTGRPALRVSYEGYDKALAVWDYEADPNFREKFLRALTRKLLGWLWPRKPPQGPARRAASGAAEAAETGDKGKSKMAA